MQEVAQHDDARRTGALDQRGEAREVGGRRRRAASARRARGTPRPCRGARRRRTACARAASTARGRRTASTASPPTTVASASTADAVPASRRGASRSDREDRESCDEGGRWTSHAGKTGTKPNANERELGCHIAQPRSQAHNGLANCSGPLPPDLTRFARGCCARGPRHAAYAAVFRKPDVSLHRSRRSSIGSARPRRRDFVRSSSPFRTSTRSRTSRRAIVRAQARGRAVQRAARRLRRPAIAASRRIPGREHEFAGGHRAGAALRARRCIARGCT